MTVTQLADDYWAFRLANHHWKNLAVGETRYLEEWPDQSLEGAARFHDGMMAFAAKAEGESAVTAVD